MSAEKVSPSLYLAAPLTTYNTARYDWAVSQARREFPQHVLLSARDLCTSTADWRVKWPRLLPTLDTIVFISEPDGAIGIGVFLEVAQMLARGRPAYYLAEQGRFPIALAYSHRPVYPTAHRFLRMCLDSACRAADPDYIATVRVG